MNILVIPTSGDGTDAIASFLAGEGHTVSRASENISPTGSEVQAADAVVLGPDCTSSLSSGWGACPKPLVAHNWEGGTIDRLALADTTFGVNGNTDDTFSYAISGTARATYPEMFLDGEEQESVSSIQLTVGASGGQREFGNVSFADDGMVILRRSGGNSSQNICLAWEAGGDDLDSNPIPARRVQWPSRTQHIDSLNETGWQVWNLLFEWAADFDEPEVYTLTINTEGEGTVDLDPEPPYGQGDDVEVDLTATPATGWLTDDPLWTGPDADGSNENDNPLVLTMDADREVTANFVLDPDYIPAPTGLNLTVIDHQRIDATVDAWDDVWTPGTPTYAWWIAKTSEGGTDPGQDAPDQVTETPAATFDSLDPNTQYEVSVAYRDPHEE